MSQEFNSFLVVLNRDTREEEAQRIASAIEMIRGVCSVSAQPADIMQHISREQAKLELRTKIWEALK